MPEPTFVAHFREFKISIESDLIRKHFPAEIYWIDSIYGPNAPSFLGPLSVVVSPSRIAIHMLQASSLKHVLSSDNVPVDAYFFYSGESNTVKESFPKDSNFYPHSKVYNWVPCSKNDYIGLMKKGDLIDIRPLANRAAENQRYFFFMDGIVLPEGFK